MYTTTVESDVPQLTVTATPNHSGAQIAYLDGDDKELTDSSASDNGFQVELPVGATVIEVKVTAEDGVAMRTYRVTVTRVEGLALRRGGVSHPWLARFARTVGTQVVNVVGERFVAPRRPGLTGQVAGRDFSRLLRTTASPEDGPAARDWARSRPGRGLHPTALAVDHTDGPRLPDQHGFLVHHGPGRRALRGTLGPGGDHALRRAGR